MAAARVAILFLHSVSASFVLLQMIVEPFFEPKKKGTPAVAFSTTFKIILIILKTPFNFLGEFSVNLGFSNICRKMSFLST